MRFFIVGLDDVKGLSNNMKAGGNQNLFVGFPDP